MLRKIRTYEARVYVNGEIKTETARAANPRAAEKLMSNRLNSYHGAGRWTYETQPH